MRRPELSEGALKVLRAARGRAIDGYSLMSKTGLHAEQLNSAIRELVDEDLVSTRGELDPKVIGDVYLVVPPTAFGYADYLLGELRFKR